MLTRRHFLKKTPQWAATLSLVGALPFLCGNTRRPNAPVMANSAIDTGRLTLRQLAEQHLHFGAKGFINPFTDARHGQLGRVLHWKLFSKNRYRPLYGKERVQPVTPDWDMLHSYDGLAVTFLKHSSVIIKDGDDYLIVDPILFDLMWFIKDYSPLDFDIKKLPSFKHILVTHGHYDHMDKASLSHTGKGSHLITPLGYDDVFAELDLNNRTQLDWYHTYTDGSRRITLLPCSHWTMRNPLTGPNQSLWGSFLIQTAGGVTIYISGDTGYFSGFKDIGREFDIDLAILNVGAYAPRWFMQPSHMNPAEAVQAFKELGARYLMAVHWGTFRLGDEPVYLPPLQVRFYMRAENLENRLLDLRHGETLFWDQRDQQIGLS